MAKDDNVCLSGFSFMCVSGAGGGGSKIHIPFNDIVSMDKLEKYLSKAFQVSCPKKCSKHVLLGDVHASAHNYYNADTCFTNNSIGKLQVGIFDRVHFLPKMSFNKYCIDIIYHMSWFTSKAL